MSVKRRIIRELAVAVLSAVLKRLRRRKAKQDQKDDDTPDIFRDLQEK